MLKVSEAEWPHPAFWSRRPRANWLMYWQAVRQWERLQKKSMENTRKGRMNCSFSFFLLLIHLFPQGGGRMLDFLLSLSLINDFISLFACLHFVSSVWAVTGAHATVLLLPRSVTCFTHNKSLAVFLSPLNPSGLSFWVVPSVPLVLPSVPTHPSLFSLHLLMLLWQWVGGGTWGGGGWSDTCWKLGRGEGAWWQPRRAGGRRG